MAKWWLLSVLLLGMAQANKPSVDLRQQFTQALEKSGSATTDCLKVADSAARGASTLAVQFKDRIWGSTAFKWQFCATTGLKFEKWKPNIETSLKKTFKEKIQTKNYAKSPWTQWDFCFSCFAQAYQVLAPDGKHEIWIEYYKYELFEGAVTVHTNKPGGFIRVGALY
jgi:hypothetical protein